MEHDIAKLKQTLEMSTQNADASKERIADLTQENRKLIEEIEELKKTGSRAPVS